jgi:phosphoribosylglycinamide formyltransferase-1
MKKTGKKLAIFASGNGTNAENIIRYFKGKDDLSVELVVCNKANAGVINRAEKLNVESLVINRSDLYDNDSLLRELRNREIDLIVLAGFLWLIPSRIIHAYPNRIVNIHPALLPKFGGKGMYGMRVHEEVHRLKEKVTGITIHLVNEKYDEGKSLFQAEVELSEDDTPEDIAQKVHQLEYEHYPLVIEEYVKNNL